MIITRVLPTIEILLLSAWSGSTWFAGLIMAPQLFGVLPSADAGNIAGLMFTSVFWLSMPALLFTLACILSSRAGHRPRLDVVLVVTAAMVLMISELVLHPWISAMRDGTLARDYFGMAHGASSVLYLASCLLAGVILVRRWSALREATGHHGNP